MSRREALAGKEARGTQTTFRWGMWPGCLCSAEQNGLRAGDIGVVTEELWALSAVRGCTDFSPDAPDPASPCPSPLPFETELEGVVAVLVLGP